MYFDFDSFGLQIWQLSLSLVVVNTPSRGLNVLAGCKFDDLHCFIEVLVRGLVRLLWISERCKRRCILLSSLQVSLALRCCLCVQRLSYLLFTLSFEVASLSVTVLHWAQLVHRWSNIVRGAL